MRWQTAFVVASLIALITAFRTYGNPERTVGVNVGDWASYTMTYEGNWTGIDMEDMVNMTMATFTVLSISATNVTMEAHGYYLNGSELVETGWIDVDTGESGGNVTEPGMLIAANLSQNDTVYTTDVEPFMDGTINETITRDYLGGPVVVNHYSINMSVEPNPFFNVSMSMDWYWHQALGIPTEIFMEYIEETAPFELPTTQTAQAESNMTWYSWHMTISSIIPEFPAMTVVPVFMIAALFIVAVSRRRVRRL